MTFTKRKVVDEINGFAELTTLSIRDIGLLVTGGYVTWNKVKARKDALAGTTIPGVTVTEVENISGSTF